jgi:alcohol dehydrogenase class IV
MSIAALQGGLAFTNSSVCLVHGMSRPLGPDISPSAWPVECGPASRGDAARFRTTVPKMASDALESGSPQNNPVVPAAEQIMELFDAAW